MEKGKEKGYKMKEMEDELGVGVKQSVITFQEHNEFPDARKSKDS